MRRPIALLLAVLAAAGCQPLPGAGPRVSTGVPGAARGVIAWLIGGDDGLASLTAHAGQITIASPAFYRVSFDASGQTTLPDWDPGNPVRREAVRAIAEARRIPLVPLVACLDDCAARISPRLDDPAARRAHVDVLAGEAEAARIGGLFIDYEEIKCSPASFGAFVDALAERLHARGRLLGVAITEPCGAPPGCDRPGYPFDIAHLARAVDHLAVMEYDLTVDGSGPVAPRDWVRAGLDRVRALAGEHVGKVHVGIPFYGRITAGVAGDTGVLWSEVRRGAIRGRGFRVVERRYDPAKLSQVLHVVMEPTGVPALIHYEDQESVADRLRLIDAAGFSGVAIWRLGGEDPASWDRLASGRSRSRAQ